MDAALPHLDDVAAPRSRHGVVAADLDVRLLADRLQLEHRVEGRDLQCAMWAGKQIRDTRIAASETQPSCCSCTATRIGITADA